MPALFRAELHPVGRGTAAGTGTEGSFCQAPAPPLTPNNSPEQACGLAGGTMGVVIQRVLGACPEIWPPPLSPMEISLP